MDQNHYPTYVLLSNHLTITMNFSAKCHQKILRISQDMEKHSQNDSTKDSKEISMRVTSIM